MLPQRDTAIYTERTQQAPPTPSAMQAGVMVTSPERGQGMALHEWSILPIV